MAISPDLVNQIKQKLHFWKVLVNTFRSMSHLPAFAFFCECQSFAIDFVNDTIGQTSEKLFMYSPILKTVLKLCKVSLA